MEMRTEVATARCPGCGRRVNLGPRPVAGHRFGCPHCGDYLEVINLEPPELDWAFDDLEPDAEPDDGDWDDAEEWGEEDWDAEAMDEEVRANGSGGSEQIQWH